MGGALLLVVRIDEVNQQQYGGCQSIKTLPSISHDSAWYHRVQNHANSVFNHAFGLGKVDSSVNFKICA